MGVAALEEWCRREVKEYPGVKITDMSSSWRDGLAFCALIHKHTNNIIHWDSIDPTDWHGNCSLAFRVAEKELGIPQLLDVDYVVGSESPDQFFIMTYVAQFYHKFSMSDSGYDSTVNNSFKYSSSEEDSPRKCLEPPGKRRGPAGQPPSDWKKRRPMGLIVSGGLELRLETPKREEATNGSVMEQQQPGGTKLYDADDEEGESSEVILSRGSGAIREAAAVTATPPMLPHQDLVFKRKRPNSLTRVSNSSAEKENTAKWKAERRSGKRGSKQAKAPEVTKRKMIGVSDYPKPYRNKDFHRAGGYLSERRREDSIESEENSSLADHPSSEHRYSHESLREKMREIPHHITESQKLLKTSIFQMPAPEFPTKCLILNIYKIKQPQYEDKSTSPPPREFCSGLQVPPCQPSLQEIDHLVKPGHQDSENCERQGRVSTENISKKEKIQKISAQKENRIPIITNKNRLLNAETGRGIPQESLTPRSRSKFEHLIRNLRESNDDEQLVLYKVMDSLAPAPAPRPGNNLRITEVVPYKGEPKDKYSVEFLWNIGAANYVGSGNSRNKQKHRRRR